MRPARCAAFLVSLALLLGCGGPSATRTATDPAPMTHLTSTDPADHWPSFRGFAAAGVADGQQLPDEWDAAGGKNIRFRTEIPGLAHASPIVWGDTIYVTSAVSGRAEASFRHGLYGDGDASDDDSVHRWMLYALNKHSGEILWERTAHEGVPQDKRHIKATYANSTPVTDGRYIVAFFGSEGVFAWDMLGNLAWRFDPGRLNVGAYNAPDYEWGSASSPIIWGDRVIVQCDTQDDSYIVALDIHSGEVAWRSERDELPSWGTPTVYPDKRRPELVVNGSNFIRGYDPATGAELWRLGGSSKITAPTPIYTSEFIVVASGRNPESPIFVIRPGAEGDITESESVVWSNDRGPYMPTPLVYGEYLYVLNNNGVFDCYLLATGEEIYRQRIPHSGGGFSGSPVAADGKLYLPGEDGQIFVVRAGAEFELIATNELGELIMTTPALSQGTMYVRAEKSLFAIGE